MGEFLPYIGAIYRRFREKEPSYYDDDVSDYIRSIGADPTQFNRYAIVPKRLDIALKAIKRYDRVPDPFSPKVRQLYDVAGDWLEKHFGPYICNSRVSSYERVLEWLDSDKSAGLPWTYRYPKKFDYWNGDNSGFFVKYWDALRTPQSIMSLCSVSIKEEVRPVEKILNKDGRTIVAMDVNHVVAHSMLCLEMNQKLVESNLEHSSALGINMFQGGWHKLNDKMSRFGVGANTIELDGKKFDGRFRYYCMRKIRDFRCKMLRSQDRTCDNIRRMSNIYYQLCHSPLVNVDGAVFARSSGNPSGQACTTPDNTLKNYMDMVVLWHLIMPEEYHTYELFNELLIMCINGDDINITVCPSVQHLFNVDAIERAMSLIDMEYHFASRHFRHNYECTFLGHGFKLCDIPHLGYPMYLPVIDCVRMRTNMLIYNEQRTVQNCIVRACGLRNETFACSDCRTWFLDLIDYLRSRYGHREDCRDSFKSYLTDRELWKMYSGLSEIDTCAGLKPGHAVGRPDI